MLNFINSIKKFFSSKCSSEHEKCSFYKPTEKRLVKLQSFSLKIQEKQWADNFLRKNINPQFSSGIRKGSFDNSAGKDLTGIWQFFAQTPKKRRLHLFLISVPQKWSSASVEWVFHFLGKNILLSGRKFFAECPKKIKIRIGPSQQFPSELNPKTVRKHDFYYPNGRFL